MKNIPNGGSINAIKTPVSTVPGDTLPLHAGKNIQKESSTEVWFSSKPPRYKTIVVTRAYKDTFYPL